MSFAQAFEGMRLELARLPPSQRLQRIAIYARVLTAELLGTLAAAPFGLRAAALHRSLPDARAGAGGGSSGRSRGTVSLLRSVRYGDRDRTVMDIYLPPKAAAELSYDSNDDSQQLSTRADAASLSGSEAASEAVDAAAAGGSPVVLFCHGGVWASGATWHYAPLATRLAQAGVVTAVMTYTLFPQAMVPQMTAEVGAALSWVLNNARSLGGDPGRVSLVGHSAGAHLCTMALLQRALLAVSDSSAGAAGTSASSARSSTAGTADAGEAEAVAGSAVDHTAAVGLTGQGDARMPARLVCLAGVFDLAKHFEYEQDRDVHELSTMARAVGGAPNFPQQSPATILAAALARDGAPAPAEHRAWGLLGAAEGDVPSGSGSSGESDSDGGAAAVQEQRQQHLQHTPAGEAPASFYRSFALRGEGIAHRLGFSRRSSAVAPTAPPAAPAAPSSAAGAEQGAAAALGNPGGSGLLGGLSVAAARRLPPVALMSSVSDTTVPFYESSEMYWLLHDAGCPAKSLVYNRLGHGEFVTGWRAAPQLGRAEGSRDLPDFAGDLLEVVAGRVPGL